VAMSTSPREAVPVLFLPGILMPASLRYERLFGVLGDDVHAVAKELEIYRGPSVPPPGYAFEDEIEGIGRAADEAGFARFHLYGHSGGGACALALAALRPERVLSLALDEPAIDFSPEDVRELREVHLPIADLPPEQRMGAFLRTLLREDVPPPAALEKRPPWMTDRPAGVAAFVRALAEADVPFERLGRFERPVYYSYGSLSNETWERMAERLSGVFPNVTVDRYEGLSHLNTSHIAEPERVAAALRRLWASAPST
jgi:pimeloyl-ACP methyl ester carboxylesterase